MKNVRYALLATTMLSVATLANVAMATEVVERPYVSFAAGYSWAHFGKTTNLQTEDQAGAPVANSLKIKSNGSASFAIGAGYRFTDNVRGDITLQYSPHYKASAEYATAKYVRYGDGITAITYPAGLYTDSTGAEVSVNSGAFPIGQRVAIQKLPAFKIRSLVTMAHLYYDFAGNPDFVPYIGIGLGVANLKVADTKLHYGANPATVVNVSGTNYTITPLQLTQEEKNKRWV